MKRFASQFGLITILFGLILLLLVGCGDGHAVKYAVQCAELNLPQDEISKAYTGQGYTVIAYKNGTVLELSAAVPCIIEAKPNE